MSINSTKELYQQLIADSRTAGLKYEKLSPSYACENYQVLANPDDLSPDEIVAVLDQGNTNFGYRHSGNFYTIYID